MNPRRVLVLGLARSGEAAALALARARREVVGVDRRSTRQRGGSRSGVEVHLGTRTRAADGVELSSRARACPASAARSPRRAARGIPVWSEIELGCQLLRRRRSSASPGTNGKTTTTELLGEIFRAAGRAVEVAGNVGRPLTARRSRSTADAWIVCELSSLPARGRHALACASRVLLNLEPDHLDRHGTLRGVPRREAAHLRARPATSRSCRAASAVPSGHRRVRRRRRAAGRAAHPGRAQPRERRRGDGCGACRRDRRRRDRRGAARLSPASRTGSSRRASCAASATSTTRRRRTSRRHGAALAAFDAPLHLILGGSRKDENFDAARRGARRPTSRASI